MVTALRGLFQRARTVASSPVALWLFLLGLCVLAYGPFLRFLGFYWDDFPISWIAHTMGGEGLERYFSTNRPFWGMLYRLTTPIIGTVPLRWQIIALVLRWLTGICFWLLLRQVWPRQARLAAWAAAFFVVYPGFQQQFVSFLYSHFYIILILFLLSQALTLMAVRHPAKAVPLHASALLFSLGNLLAMEYFFLLDLLRPLLIWIVLSETVPDWKTRLLRTVKIWLPYLAIFIGVMVWRSLFFGFQTYQPTLISRLKTQPLQALPELITTVLVDVWRTGVEAWARAFRFPLVDPTLFREQWYWMLVIAAAVFALAFLLLHQPERRQKTRDDRRTLWQPLLIGLLAMLIAGGPFWLTDLKIGLEFAVDRFTLPFALGASVALAALLVMVPGPTWGKVPVVAVLLAAAAGLHFQNAAQYRADWTVQGRLFWQMTWRMPDLKPGTLLLMNELDIIHYTDNSLAAPLNWTYDTTNNPQPMKYMLYYIGLRTEPWILNVLPDQPIRREYLATDFPGSSSQVIVLYSEPPGCLRVLDSEVDAENWMVPANLRNMLPLTNPGQILYAPAEDKPAPRPPEHIYGPEIPRGWCYYYEQAELARQFSDWETITALAEIAFASGDYPNDPAERFPFIEGYARTGSWQSALRLTDESRQVTELMSAPLCSLWDRIERETTGTPGQEAAVTAARSMLGCHANP